MTPSPWQELERDDPAHEHVAHLYRAREFPATAVATWIGDALRGGQAAIMVGTPPHVRDVRARLRDMEGVDLARAEATGLLQVVDADAWLTELCESGRVVNARVLAGARAAIARARAVSADSGRVRIWGEMVDLLWQRGRVLAARRLDACWNDVIREAHVDVLCTYEADNLDPSMHAGPVQDICATHTHLVPETEDARFDAAVTRALVEVFGEAEAVTVRKLFASDARHATRMPRAQAILMGLNDVSHALAARVIAAAREHWAREDGRTDSRTT